MDGIHGYVLTTIVRVDCFMVVCRYASYTTKCSNIASGSNRGISSYSLKHACLRK